MIEKKLATARVEWIDQLPEIPKPDMLAIKCLYFNVSRSKEISKRRSNAFKKQISKIREEVNVKDLSEKLWNTIQKSRELQ